MNRSDSSDIILQNPAPQAADLKICSSNCVFLEDENWVSPSDQVGKDTHTSFKTWSRSKGSSDIITYCISNQSFIIALTCPH